MAIFRGVGGAVGSTTSAVISEATEAAQTATEKAAEAAASASNAATSKINAATSASNALSSATSAAASAALYEDFLDRYLGAKATAPTTDNDGNPLQVGVLYYSENDEELLVWSGSAWVSPLVSPAIRDGFTGNGSTVAFTLSRDPSTEANTQVYINGIYQNKSTYSVSETTLTFSTAPEDGDSIEVMSQKSTSVLMADTDNATYTATGAGAVTRTLNEKLGDTVSVKDFGAVGDGVTDDTAAIQAALDSGAFVIHVPVGTYLVTGLTFAGTSSEPKEYLKFYGEGTLKLKNNSDSTVFYATYVNKLFIEGIEVDGNATNQSAGNWYGIAVLYCKDLTVNRCKVHDCYHSGVLARGIRQTNITNNICYTNGTGNTYAGDGLTVVCSYGQIANNTCYGNNPSYDGDGIQINRNTTDSSGWWSSSVDNKTLCITGNSCFSNGRRGIKIQRENVLCTGNSCARNESVQIGVYESVNLYNITVTGNIIGDSFTNSTASFVVDMFSSTVTGLTLTGNSFAGSVSNHALDFDGVTSLDVQGNIFNFISVAGTTVLLRDTTTNCNITVPTDSVADAGTNNIVVKALYPELSFSDVAVATANIATGNITTCNVDKFIASNRTELTITSGFVTPTKMYHSIDTEGNASSDELTGMAGGVDGQIVILRTASSSRDIVVKHNIAPVAGAKLYLNSGTDCLLSTTLDTLMFIYDSFANVWLEISRSDNF